MSDTHVPDRQPSIPESILEGLRGVDLIVHAGDLTCLDVLSLLEKIAPVRAVSGNMDLPEVRSKLGETLVFEACGKTIAVMHGRGSPAETENRARSAFPDADVVIFGHTHRPFMEYRGKALLLNPGPASGFLCWKPSYAILQLADEGDELPTAQIHRL
ncbi:MAG: metallophosphoesterase [Firmicutes bacterium]|nr:metallophosphoesterase [Candidatus Fermentithermobacillaceae bacterium]